MVNSTLVISSYAKSPSSYMENDLPKCYYTTFTFGWKQTLLLCIVGYLM